MRRTACGALRKSNSASRNEQENRLEPRLSDSYSVAGPPPRHQLLETSELVAQVNNRYVDEYLIPLFIDHLDFVTNRWLPEDIIHTSRFRNMLMGSVMLRSQSVDNSVLANP